MSILLLAAEGIGAATVGFMLAAAYDRVNDDE